MVSNKKYKEKKNILHETKRSNPQSKWSISYLLCELCKFLQALSFPSLDFHIYEMGKVVLSYGLCR